MNEIQKAYLKAKVDYEAAQKAASAEAPFEVADDITEEELDAYLEVQVDAEIAAEEKYQVWEKFALLQEAQQKLFDWAKAKVAREMAHDPRLQEALSAYDKVKKFPSFTGKLVDLCLTLEA